MDSQFDTGAVRSADADGLDFLSISPVAMIALARTCQEGAVKYGHHNWELGMPTTDLLNHAQRHLWMWQAGDRSEPHLPHAFWGIMAAIHMDTLHPELSAARTRGPGCSVTPAMRDHLERTAGPRAAQRKAGKFAALGNWFLDQVAEIRTILGGRPREIHVSAETSLAFADAADIEEAVGLGQGGYRGNMVEGPPLRDRLRGNFHRAGVTDSDIIDEPPLLDLDDDDLPVGDATGFHPAFEKIPRT